MIKGEIIKYKIYLKFVGLEMSWGSKSFNEIEYLGQLNVKMLSVVPSCNLYSHSELFITLIFANIVTSSKNLILAQSRWWSAKENLQGMLQAIEKVLFL